MVEKSNTLNPKRDQKPHWRMMESSILNPKRQRQVPRSGGSSGDRRSACSSSTGRSSSIWKESEQESSRATASRCTGLSWRPCSWQPGWCTFDEARAVPLMLRTTPPAVRGAKVPSRNVLVQIRENLSSTLSDNHGSDCRLQAQTVLDTRSLRGPLLP